MTECLGMVVHKEENLNSNQMALTAKEQQTSVR